MYLEQTYTLRQNYLNEIKYKPTLNAIDENTSSAQIVKYIEEALAEPAQEALAPDITSLHKQLEYIVYLNTLSYYYASGINPYNPFNAFTPIQRLRTMGKLIEEKQILLSNGLQIFIENIFQEDKAAENLIKKEINYLTTVCDSVLSSEVEKSNQSHQIIDIAKMKSQSDEDSKKLQAALDRYIDRCGKEKGNQPNTPSSSMEDTTMPELKNDTLEEQKKNKAPDSGNYSDDASEASDYEDALEYLEEQPQTTSQVKNNAIEESLETSVEPMIHTENQQQNASNKNTLLTQLWDLLIKAWQYIKNIFKYFTENDDLNNAARVQTSHPAPQQSTFEESMPPLAAGTKKPALTRMSVTNTPQFFPSKKPTIKEAYNRTAEWVSRHL